MAIYVKTNTFSANTLIQSSQVNTNFNEISTAINTTILAGMTQYGLLVGTGTSSAPAAIAPDASTTKLLVSGGASAVPAWTNVTATQAQQETGTSTTVFVTPGVQQYHASSCKGWGYVNMNGTATTSYNIASVTDGGVGDATVNWTVAFSGGNYPVIANAKMDPTGAAASTPICYVYSTSLGTGTARIAVRKLSDAAALDPDQILVAAFGDQ